MPQKSYDRKGSDVIYISGGVFPRLDAKMN
jgi:hypothetical protein